MAYSKIELRTGSYRQLSFSCDENWDSFNLTISTQSEPFFLFACRKVRTRKNGRRNAVKRRAFTRKRFGRRGNEGKERRGAIGKPRRVSNSLRRQISPSFYPSSSFHSLFSTSPRIQRIVIMQWITYFLFLLSFRISFPPFTLVKFLPSVELSKNERELLVPEIFQEFEENKELSSE